MNNIQIDDVVHKIVNEDFKPNPTLYVLFDSIATVTPVNVKTKML